MIDPYKDDPLVLMARVLEDCLDQLAIMISEHGDKAERICLPMYEHLAGEVRELWERHETLKDIKERRANFAKSRKAKKQGGE